MKHYNDGKAKTFITNISREDYDSDALKMFFDQNDQFLVTDDATDVYGNPIPSSVAVHTSDGMGGEDARYFSGFMQLYLNLK